MIYTSGFFFIDLVTESRRKSVCVCVCVCEREGEREELRGGYFKWNG